MKTKSMSSRDLNFSRSIPGGEADRSACPNTALSSQNRIEIANELLKRDPKNAEAQTNAINLATEWMNQSPPLTDSFEILVVASVFYAFKELPACKKALIDIANNLSRLSADVVSQFDFEDVYDLKRLFIKQLFKQIPEGHLAYQNLENHGSKSSKPEIRVHDTESRVTNRFTKPPVNKLHASHSQPQILSNTSTRALQSKKQTALTEEQKIKIIQLINKLERFKSIRKKSEEHNKNDGRTPEQRENDLSINLGKSFAAISQVDEATFKALVNIKNNAEVNNMLNDLRKLLGELTRDWIKANHILNLSLQNIGNGLKKALATGLVASTDEIFIEGAAKVCRYISEKGKNLELTSQMAGNLSNFLKDLLVFNVRDERIKFAAACNVMFKLIIKGIINKDSITLSNVCNLLKAILEKIEKNDGMYVSAIDQEKLVAVCDLAFQMIAEKWVDFNDLQCISNVGNFLKAALITDIAINRKLLVMAIQKIIDLFIKTRNQAKNEQQFSNICSLLSFVLDMLRKETLLEMQAIDKERFRTACEIAVVTIAGQCIVFKKTQHVSAIGNFLKRMVDFEDDPTFGVRNQYKEDLRKACEYEIYLIANTRIDSNISQNICNAESFLYVVLRKMSVLKVSNLKELREACFYLIEMDVGGNIDYSIAVSINNTCNFLAAVLELQNILQLDASQMRVVRIACENLTEVIAKGNPSHVDALKNDHSMQNFLYEVLKKISIGNADALNSACQNVVVLISQGNIDKTSDAAMNIALCFLRFVLRNGIEVNEQALKKAFLKMINFVLDEDINKVSTPLFSSILLFLAEVSENPLGISSKLLNKAYQKMVDLIVNKKIDMTNGLAISTKIYFLRFMLKREKLGTNFGEKLRSACKKESDAMLSLIVNRKFQSNKLRDISNLKTLENYLHPPEKQKEEGTPQVKLIEAPKAPPQKMPTQEASREIVQAAPPINNTQPDSLKKTTPRKRQAPEKGETLDLSLFSIKKQRKEKPATPKVQPILQKNTQQPAPATKPVPNYRQPDFDIEEILGFLPTSGENPGKANIVAPKKKETPIAALVAPISNVSATTNVNKGAPYNEAANKQFPIHSAANPKWVHPDFCDPLDATKCAPGVAVTKVWFYNSGPQAFSNVFWIARENFEAAGHHFPFASPKTMHDDLVKSVEEELKAMIKGQYPPSFQKIKAVRVTPDQCDSTEEAHQLTGEWGLIPADNKPPFLLCVFSGAWLDSDKADNDYLQYVQKTFHVTEKAALKINEDYGINVSIYNSKPDATGEKPMVTVAPYGNGNFAHLCNSSFTVGPNGKMYGDPEKCNAAFWDVLVKIFDAKGVERTITLPVMILVRPIEPGKQIKVSYDPAGRYTLDYSINF